jgi:hypothetical protein
MRLESHLLHDARIWERSDFERIYRTITREAKALTSDARQRGAWASLLPPMTIPTSPSPSSGFRASSPMIPPLWPSLTSHATSPSTSFATPENRDNDENDYRKWKRKMKSPDSPIFRGARKLVPAREILGEMARITLLYYLKTYRPSRFTNKEHKS